MGTCLSKPENNNTKVCLAHACCPCHNEPPQAHTNGATPATVRHHLTRTSATHPTAQEDGFHNARPALGRVSSANSLASDLYVDALEEPGPTVPPPYQPTVPSATMQDVMRAVAMGQAINPSASMGSVPQSKSTTLSKVNLIAPSDSDEWLNDLLGTSGRLSTHGYLLLPILMDAFLCMSPTTVMLWPFLRAAAHTEVLRIAGPVLDNMPPFVANVLLPGLGTVVSIPIQGIAAAIKMYAHAFSAHQCVHNVLCFFPLSTMHVMRGVNRVDMLGPHPPRLVIHNVAPTPEGHVALDWQCVWRMEGTAALAVTPTMATSGAAAQAGVIKGMAKSLKSKALRFHSHIMSEMGSSRCCAADVVLMCC